MRQHRYVRCSAYRRIRDDSKKCGFEHVRCLKRAVGFDKNMQPLCRECMARRKEKP